MSYGTKILFSEEEKKQYEEIVFDMYLEGESGNSIAEHIGVSAYTVHSLKKNLIDKRKAY